MKKLVTLLVVSVFASAAFAGPTLTWGSAYCFSFSGNPDIIGPTGVAVPQSSTYAAMIMEQTTFTPLYTNAAGFWSDLGLDGVAYASFDAPDTWLNKAIFTRIYNHATPALATFYVDAGFTNMTWVTSPPASEGNYNIGKITQGQWQAVPEPAALVFSLIGFGAIVVRRIRQRNAV